MTGSVLESDLIDGVTTAPYVCEGGFCGAVTPSAYTQSKPTRSEEHTSELQSLMRISYAVFCLKKQKNNTPHVITPMTHRKYHTNYTLTNNSQTSRHTYIS